MYISSLENNLCDEKSIKYKNFKKGFLVSFPAKRNKTGFILYAPDFPPLNSRVKIKQVFNFFSTLGFMASIKNIKQNIRENIVQRALVFETSIKVLRQIIKAQSLIFLIYCHNFNADSVKL